MITLLAKVVPEMPFDAMEIHPCKTENGNGMLRSNTELVEQCEPEEAEFWSVYVHYVGGGIDSIADCTTEAEAKDVVTFLSFYVRLCTIPHI